MTALVEHGENQPKNEFIYQWIQEAQKNLINIESKYEFLPFVSHSIFAKQLIQQQIFLE